MCLKPYYVHFLMSKKSKDILDIDDQSTTYVFESKGTQALFFNLFKNINMLNQFKQCMEE